MAAAMKALGVLYASLALSGLALAGCGSKSDQAPPPRQPPSSTADEVRPPVTNVAHAVANLNTNRSGQRDADSTVQQWIGERNERTRTQLDASEQRPLIKDRLERLWAGLSPDYSGLTRRYGLLFALKGIPTNRSPVLVTLLSFTNLHPERVVLDPNRMEGAPRLDWFVPSTDGKWVAVCLSQTNRPRPELRILDAATGELRPEIIPRVGGAGTRGSAAWNADSSGLFYTRYEMSETPGQSNWLQGQILLHRLGTSTDEDHYELGKDFPRGAITELKSSPDGQRLVASVSSSESSARTHYLRDPTGAWQAIAESADYVTQVEFGRDPLYIEWGNDPALYLLSCREAPKGKILRLPFGAALTNAAVILPEENDAILNFKPGASGLGLVFSHDGISQFGYLDYFDGKVSRVEERRLATISDLVVLGGDDILYRVETYTEPYEWLQYNSSRHKDRINSTVFAGEANVSFDDVQVTRRTVPGKNGRPVWLDLIYRRGIQLTNSTPTLLSWEEGLDNRRVLHFDVLRRLWLDHGGAFALASLPNEPGPGQPDSGGGPTAAQKRVDELAACAEYLVHSNYTSAAKLAVRGGRSEVVPREADLAPSAEADPRTRVDQVTDIYTVLCERLGIYYSQVDRGPWSGGMTSTSAVVKAKLIREGLTARLLVGRSASWAAAGEGSTAVSELSHGDVVQFVSASLEPGTQYYYALEVNGRLERDKTGAFRTLPAPGPASFTFAFAGDARTGSVSDVFDRIREHAPLFFMNLGDFHYLDIQSTNRADFRDGYDLVLASPQQSALYRAVPFVYIWDDHDFAGNNSNRKAPARGAARLTYDEYVPHYPLPLREIERDGGPICQSFAVGRVKFILTDLRSERDEARKKDDFAKSMMGAAQKAWFKKELLAANGRYPLICWASSVPWIGKAGTNFYYGVKTNQYGYIHHTQLAATANIRTNQNVVPGAEDWWSVYSTERREIADFIKQNAIRGLCILHADSHMLAADDGSHSDYATGGGVSIAVMCAAPLDKEPSIKGGPYSQGIYRVRPGEGCFGLVTVTDRGSQIDVSYSGRNNRDEEKISLQFSVAAPANGAP